MCPRRTVCVDDHARQPGRVEPGLSHLQGDPLERAYQRGDTIEKRRQLMLAWADDCESGEQTVSNVVAIGA